MKEGTRPSEFLPEALIAGLLRLYPIALAFSGGLDSRFLAHAARSAGGGIALLHVRGPHVAPAESESAVAWAEEHGFSLSLLAHDPLCSEAVRQGAKDRCYHCKRRMFELLLRHIDQSPSLRGSTLCDGSNASDQELYRPGLRALAELGIRSPLAEAGLNKADIRRIGAASGLDRPDQAARPCLLTRFAYGIAPTPEVLAALGSAEAELERLLASCAWAFARAPDFRLRLTALSGRRKAGAPLFAPELHLERQPPPDLAAALIKAVRDKGFSAPRIVIAEKLSGHFDR